MGDFIYANVDPPLEQLQYILLGACDWFLVSFISVPLNFPSGEAQ
jgi:hypothetical protein